MLANQDGAVRQHRLITKYGVALAALFFSLFFTAANISAQNTFSSGSTGADGAFAPVGIKPSLSRRAASLISPQSISRQT